MTLHDEIAEQPEVAARFLDTQTDPIEAIAAALRERPVRQVVIAARGTSDHAALYAQYVLGIRHRLSVALGTPSIVSLYGVVPDFTDTLVVGISQSGASPDIVAVIAAARAQGAPTVAITNEPRSALAVAADRTIDLGAGPERAIAATKTYTTELLAIVLLSAELAGDPADRAALAAIPETLGRARDLEPDIERIAAEQAGSDRTLVITRGFEYATAREWALKLSGLAPTKRPRADHAAARRPSGLAPTTRPRPDRAAPECGSSVGSICVLACSPSRDPSAPRTAERISRPPGEQPSGYRPL